MNLVPDHGSRTQSRGFRWRVSLSEAKQGRVWEGGARDPGIRSPWHTKARSYNIFSPQLDDLKSFRIWFLADRHPEAVAMGPWRLPGNP